MPAEVTSFVGRRRELDEVRDTLATARLVTLTGPGGVGKSRLALRIAQRHRRGFPDGVWLVELADLREASLLGTTVAEALGLGDWSGLDARSALTQYLAGKRVLLVLDNCEHLADACAELVTALLSAAPELRVLVTTRDAFGISGEHVISVLPLPVDGDSREAKKSDAIALFEERAAAVVPGFVVDATNRDVVTRLCEKLDGLPLAIELAAVRMRALSPEQILQRLDHRGDLLAGVRYVSPGHHHAMLSAVGWSYNLCSAEERAMWQRISVFAGGFDLESAEVVCSDEYLRGSAIMDCLVGLVAQSVLIRDGSETQARYRLLETIRYYGRLRLQEADEQIPLGRRHRDYFLRLAEHAEANWFGPDQLALLARLRAERANFQAAMEFCLSTPGEARTGQRLAAALWCYWIGRGYLVEGAHWLDRMLAADERPTPERARALWVRGWIAQAQGQPQETLLILQQAQEVAKQVGDERVLAYATQLAGCGELYVGHFGRASELLDEAIAAYRAAGEESCLSALAIMQASLVARHMGDLQRAAELAERSRALCAAHRERWTRSYALASLGDVARARGDHWAARDYMREALRIGRDFDNRLAIALSVENLAWTAGTLGAPEQAAVLFGAARQLWDSIGTPMFGFAGSLASRRRHEAAVRRVLGAESFEAAYRVGARMSLDEAEAYALGETLARETGPARPVAPLTRREWEIADLVAQGMSNKDIASQLVIAPRTAESHVEHIFTKLGFSSRTQLAAWVAERVGQSATQGRS